MLYYGRSLSSVAPVFLFWEISLWADYHILCQRRKSFIFYAGILCWIRAPQDVDVLGVLDLWRLRTRLQSRHGLPSFWSAALRSWCATGLPQSSGIQSRSLSLTLRAETRNLEIKDGEPRAGRGHRRPAEACLRYVRFWSSLELTIVKVTWFWRKGRNSVEYCYSRKNFGSGKAWNNLFFCLTHFWWSFLIYFLI